MACRVQSAAGMVTRNFVTLVALVGSAGGCVADIDVEDDMASDESSGSSDLDAVIARHGDDHRLPNHVPVFDPTGVFTTVSSNAFIDLNTEFFQDLGTNGRRCVSCHVPTTGWTITPHAPQT